MEVEPYFILIGLLVLAVILDFLAVAARTGLSQANLARLLSQREQMDKDIRHTLDMVHAQPRLEVSLHFTRLFGRFVMAGLALALLVPAAWTWENGLLELLVLGLGAVLVFYLEEGIEAAVGRQPEQWAIRLTPFVRGLMWVQSPFIYLAVRLHNDKRLAAESQNTVTQDELINLLETGHQDGVLEQDERQMIASIFRLDDTLAREIMVPRIYITALDVNIALEDAVDALLSSGHSRVPVYEETVDNIVGILYAKDLLRAWRDSGQAQSLRSLLREAYFVPEAKKVDELLDEMQSRQVHMAMVVDEYGGIAGVVTLEDIVEEIVGEIRDEYDQAEELPFQEVGKGEYIFQGRVALDDFNAVMQTSLPLDEAETLGGFIYSQIGRVPVNAESIEINDLILTVEQVSGRRIRKVRARHIPRVFEDGSEGESNVD
jgi:CBS domain containing-hemolysin-like protein